MKIKLLLTAILLIDFMVAHSQNNQNVSSFANLETLTLANGIKIHYPASGTTVFNKLCKDLPATDPFSTKPEDPEEGMIKLLQLKIGSDNAQALTVLFTEGPSDDPGFVFCKTNGDWITELGDMELFISGNGYIYTTGHTNTAFNKKSKYYFNGEVFSEVKQPFYYVGLKTQTTKTITLYVDKNEVDAVATVPANTDVEVLLTEYNQNFGDYRYFLIKTPLGLVGWVGFPTYNLSEGTPLKGIYYAGD